MMRKLFLSILSILIFTSPLRGQIYKQEAEAALFDSLLLLHDSDASEGRFVRMEQSGSLKWIASMDEEGWYKININYRAFNGEKEEYLIKNGTQIPVGFGIADDWSIFHKDIYLNKGENSLEIRPSWGYLDIDYLCLEKALPDYSLTPQYNNYYLDFPRDLLVKLDNFKSPVAAVMIKEKRLKFIQEEYPFDEKSAKLILPGINFADMEPGTYTMTILLENGIKLQGNLTIRAHPEHDALTIIAPYVDHGSAVLIILPDKRTMLVDCAKDYIRDKTLIPLIQQIGIDTLDYFILTHYHEDHDSGDRGEKIKQLFHVREFFDYQSFRTGQSFEKSGVNFKILNTYADGEDENTRSLAFKMEFKGFVYSHGADIYDTNQIKIRNRFPDDVAADVYNANHHFHGSVDVPYLREMRPDVVVIQAQEAIYARSAYWEKYLLDTRDYLQKH
ncbi:hypothetical protein JXB12_01825, partial [candidate division KSB1 bacterium]|nr:hypothetical protein [candidate division KSB1 bacterium]